MKIWNDDNSNIKEQACPGCKAKLNATTLIGDDDGVRPPKPGDYSICAYCGIIIRFTEGLNHEEVTIDYVDEHCHRDFSEELRRVQEIVKQNIEQRKHEKDNREDK